MITRKIQLLPVGDKEEVSRIYKYLRDGIYNQNKAMNQYMSSLYLSEMYETTKEDRKELRNLYARVNSSKKGSAYGSDIEIPKGYRLGLITQKVESDFKKSKKDGLMSGKVSLPTYKKDNPLMMHVDDCNLRKFTSRNNGIYHNYESHNDFLEHLHKKDIEIFFQYVNGILFKLNLGNNLKKSYALRVEIQKIFEEEFKIHGSKIQLRKRKDGKGDNIFLLLSIETPEIKHELDENTVVGVDLGIRTPAVCALNNDWYPREYIGNGQTFIHHKQKIKLQRRNIAKNLSMCTGGHGRKKKLQKLDKLSGSESNFADTYSHKISKEVVDFAIKHNAKYINIEDLKGIDTEHEKLLGLWKYFQTQQFIEYKALKHGITVRKINPYLTSQTCSVCGHYEDGQRDKADFCCKTCGTKLNADYNAARNIAMSTNFVKTNNTEE